MRETEVVDKRETPGSKRGGLRRRRLRDLLQGSNSSRVVAEK